MDNERITSLLGAGAVLEIGAPSTSELTKLTKGILDESVRKLINNSSVIRLLNGDVFGENKTFEDILAALEVLYSLEKRFQQEYRGNLMEDIFDFDFDMNKNIKKVEKNAIDVVDSIKKRILKYDNDFRMQDNKEDSPFAKFWKEICHGRNMDIVTLNYDTCIEHVLNNHRIPFTDGFDVPVYEYNSNAFNGKGGLHRITVTQNHYQNPMYAFDFNPDLIFKPADQNLIMHLHGCAYYGFGAFYEHDLKHSNELDENEYALKKYKAVYSLPGYEDLFKIRRTQAGQYIFVTSILIGLQKTEKINASPFDYYYHKFSNSIIKNPSLLIIGYSFGDLYINQLLSHFYMLHGNHRRVVIITYYSEDDMADYSLDDLTKENRNPSPDAARTITRLMHPKEGEDEFPGLLYRFYGKKDFIPSGDGTVRVYYRGFYDAAKNHDEEIIDFLNFKEKSIEKTIQSKAVSGRNV